MLLALRGDLSLSSSTVVLALVVLGVLGIGLIYFFNSRRSHHLTGENEDQKEEIEGQKEEIEGQKEEIEGQKEEIEGQKEEIEGQKEEIAHWEVTEERLRLAVRGTSDGLWDWDVKTNVNWYSDRFHEILDYEVGDLAANLDSFRDILHPAEHEMVFGAVAAHFEADARYDVEMRLRKQGGDWLWVRSRGECIRDEDGTPVRMAGSIQDIHRQKIAEENYQSIFEQAAVGIARVGPDGSWLEVNDRLCQIVGYDRDELMARTFQDITHPDDLEADLDLYTQLKNGVIPHYSMRKRYVRKDRKKVWINLTVAIKRDDQGEPDFAVSVIEDISGQKRIEDQIRRNERRLRKVNKELDQFAYVASHDLRSPLRAIRKLAEWTVEDEADNLEGESLENLKEITKRIDLLDRLLEDLLQYSRSGQTSSESTEIDLGELIQEILAVIDVPEGFIVHVAEDLPVLETGRVPLSQVLRNLIHNAIKHHDQTAGNIYIEATDAGDLIEISVRDDGPGISPRHHQRIFGIFESLKSAEDGGGSGMGLAIIQKIVEAHGGNVEVKSEDGQGADFRFTWPKMPEDSTNEY